MIGPVNTPFQTVSILALVLLIGTGVYAQNGIEAGIRLGNNPGNAVAIDGVFPLGQKTRLHPAVYFLHNGLGGGLYLDWLIDLGDGFRLYPGIGPEIYFDRHTEAGIAANLGAEYAFQFPLTLSIDYRPTITFVNELDLFAENWGISLRY